MSDNFMNNQNALDVLGEYADAIKDNRIVHKTYNEFLALTQAQIDSGNFIVTNIPTTHGKVQILDKLWENPDSSSTSQGETIANIANVADYAFIIVECYHTGLTGRATHLKPVVTSQNSWIEFHNASGGGSAGGGQLLYRAVGINTAAGTVTISDGHKVSTTGVDTVDSTLLIPKAIYGLKSAVEVSAFIDQPANEIYSLNEQRIGTWIDGKPLYQRTFTLTLSCTGGGTSQTYDLSSWNIKDIISQSEYMRRKASGSSNNYQHHVEWQYGTSGTESYDVSTYYSNNNGLFCIFYGTVSSPTVYDGATAHFTLKYTKTTD